MKRDRRAYGERGEEREEAGGLQRDLARAGDAGGLLERDGAPAGERGAGGAVADEEEADGVEEEGERLAQDLEGRVADDEVLRGGEDGVEHGGETRQVRGELLQRVQTSGETVARAALAVEVLVEERGIAVVLLDVVADQIVYDGQEHTRELLRALLRRRQVRRQVHYASIPAGIATERGAEVVAHGGVARGEDLLEDGGEDLRELHEKRLAQQLAHAEQVFRGRGGDLQLVRRVAARSEGIPAGRLVGAEGVGDHGDEELDELDEGGEVVLHHPEEGEGELDEVGVARGALAVDLLHEGVDDHLAGAEQLRLLRHVQVVAVDAQVNAAHDLQERVAPHGVGGELALQTTHERAEIQAHLQHGLHERAGVVVAERGDEVGGVGAVLVVIRDVLLLVIAVVVAVATPHAARSPALHVVEVGVLDVVVLDAEKQALQQLAHLRLRLLAAHDSLSPPLPNAVVVIPRDVGEQRRQRVQRQVRDLQPRERQQRHDERQEVAVDGGVTGQPVGQQRLLRDAEVDHRAGREEEAVNSQVVGLIDVVKAVLVGEVAAQHARNVHDFAQHRQREAAVGAGVLHSARERRPPGSLGHVAQKGEDFGQDLLVEGEGVEGRGDVLEVGLQRALQQLGVRL